MMHGPDERLTKIGIFYDGGYFQAVSDWYRYCHALNRRLSISGIHHFVKQEASKREKVDPCYCQVVDAHYFRGRYSAQEAKVAKKLFPDRAFDEVLMHAGVAMHYLPRTQFGEKGIDVWFALEAYELAVYKRFNILVLVTGDGDFLPLVRKLNTMGTRVMLLAWNLGTNYDKKGYKHETKVAKVLMEEAAYPIEMHPLIDEATQGGNTSLIDSLFVSPDSDVEENDFSTETTVSQESAPSYDIGSWRKGIIKHLPDKKYYGFIKDDEFPFDKWFFHGSNVHGSQFFELREGDIVTFQVAVNEEHEEKKLHAVCVTQEENPGSSM